LPALAGGAEGTYSLDFDLTLTNGTVLLTNWTEEVFIGTDNGATPTYTFTATPSTITPSGSTIITGEVEGLAGCSDATVSVQFDQQYLSCTPTSTGLEQDSCASLATNITCIAKGVGGVTNVTLTVTGSGVSATESVQVTIALPPSPPPPSPPPPSPPPPASIRSPPPPVNRPPAPPGGVSPGITVLIPLVILI
jgi:hypothetical protein